MPNCGRSLRLSPQNFAKVKASKLLRWRQRLAQVERNLGRFRMNARREDARRKIQLGGLVIKSGMADYPASVILGALTLAAGALTGPNADATKARFEAAGEEADGRAESRERGWQ